MGTMFGCCSCRRVLICESARRREGNAGKGGCCNETEQTRWQAANLVANLVQTRGDFFEIQDLHRHLDSARAHGHTFERDTTWAIEMCAMRAEPSAHLLARILDRRGVDGGKGTRADVRVQHVVIRTRGVLLRTGHAHTRSLHPVRRCAQTHGNMHAALPWHRQPALPPPPPPPAAHPGQLLPWPPPCPQTPVTAPRRGCVWGATGECGPSPFGASISLRRALRGVRGVPAFRPCAAARVCVCECARVCMCAPSSTPSSHEDGFVWEGQTPSLGKGQTAAWCVLVCVCLLRGVCCCVVGARRGLVCWWASSASDAAGTSSHGSGDERRSRARARRQQWPSRLGPRHRHTRAL